MTTLIESRSSNSSPRRCDARCYNGKKTKCRCICGGRNHGQGLERSIRRTVEEIFPEIMKSDHNHHYSLGSQIQEPPLFVQTNFSSIPEHFNYFEATREEIEHRMLF